jgi:hypothetical protein
MSESFDLCDVETGLRQSMMATEATHTLRHIRSARFSRLIEANSAETRRLMDECKHVTGEEWMERKERISVLFKEHARLCEVWGKSGPREEAPR